MRAISEHALNKNLFRFSWCILRTSFIRPTKGAGPGARTGETRKFKTNGWHKRDRCIYAYFSFAFRAPPLPGFSEKVKCKWRIIFSLSNLFWNYSLKELEPHILLFPPTGAVNPLSMKLRSSEPENFERQTTAEWQAFAFSLRGDLFAWIDS